MGAPIGGGVIDLDRISSRQVSLTLLANHQTYCLVCIVAIAHVDACDEI